MTKIIKIGLIILKLTKKPQTFQKLRTLWNTLYLFWACYRYINYRVLLWVKTINIYYSFQLIKYAISIIEVSLL